MMCICSLSSDKMAAYGALIKNDSVDSVGAVVASAYASESVSPSQRRQ